MKKNIVYFVLYIVLVSELLVVITERDELDASQEAIKDSMIVSLANIYRSPLFLSVPNPDIKVDVKSTSDTVRVIFSPTGLVSSEEKKNITYYVKVTSGSKPSGWDWDLLSSKKSEKNYRINVDQTTGNGVFIANIKEKGKFSFEVYFKVERSLPGYLTAELMTDLKEKIKSASHEQSFEKNNKRVSNKVSFVVEGIQQGIKVDTSF